MRSGSCAGRWSQSRGAGARAATSAPAAAAAVPAAAPGPPRFALSPAAPGAAASRSLWMSRRPLTGWPPSRTEFCGLLATMAITRVTPARKVRRREAVLSEMWVGGGRSGAQGCGVGGCAVGHLQPCPPCHNHIPGLLDLGGEKYARRLLSSVLNLEAALGAGCLNPRVCGQSQSWGWRRAEDRVRAPDRRSAHQWLVYAWRRLTWLFHQQTITTWATHS